MNPATAMWINLLITALGGATSAIAAGGGGSQVTMWAGAIAGVVGAVNTALHAVSTNQPGPLAK